MNDELKYSITKFKDAVKKLDEGIKQSRNQLDRDGVIQRFEFSFELLWKTMKLFLLDQGIITNSPKEVLKETYRFGIITDEELFLDMLDDRNQTSHIYSEDISKEIFIRIKKNYLASMKKLLKELKERTGF